MSTSLLDRHAEKIFLSACRHITVGRLTVRTSSGTWHFGPADAQLTATLVVSDPRLFRRALVSGTIGFGEAYMDGDWTSPDLVALVRLMLRNLPALGRMSGLLARVAQWGAIAARTLRDNTVRGSRRNIHRHYDLGNEFFRLFLDTNLLYSCACFEDADDTLERAQIRKLERICRKLRLGPDDHVLEIGTGWGGFAAYAATRYGCRVTTTTISREQHAYAAAWFGTLGEAGRRITLLDKDYRELDGQFDRIVSIEMFEAVGYRHYDEFFTALDRLLVADGAALIQAITVDDQRFDAYRAAPDWIEKYIFPGSQLASIGAMLQSAARSTSLAAHHLENIGLHYAKTLNVWRERFWHRIGSVRALGFDERFVRMWDLYLAYCEAAFAERYIGDVQLLLTKLSSQAPLFGDPLAPHTTAAVPAAVDSLPLAI